MGKNKVNLPNKDAGRKLSDFLKDLGNQPAPQDLIDKINNEEETEEHPVNSPEFLRET